MAERAELVVPATPEFRRPQRARVVLDFREGDEHVHAATDGWALIDGPWLHFNDDEFGLWQSWPMAHVVCVDWLVQG